MTDDDEEKASGIVITLGNGFIKAGFAGDDTPRAVFPNIVRSPKNEVILPGQKRHFYVGDDGYRHNKHFPIERGHIVDEEAIESIFHHTFYNELRVDPTEQPVLLGINYFTTRKEKEHLFKYLFETVGIKSLFLMNRSELALFATGNTTGVVLSSGHGCTSFCAVREGYVDMETATKIDFGGGELTNLTRDILNEKGYNKFTTSSEMEVVRDIKEKLCFVAIDKTDELMKNHEKNYELPCGTTIQVEKCRFSVPEAYFKPSIYGLNFFGVQDSLYNLINMSPDHSTRTKFAKTIVLNGGSTLFKGFNERLHKELRINFKKELQIDVAANPERKYFSWIGGSIIGSLCTREQYFCSKEKYMEHGPAI